VAPGGRHVVEFYCHGKQQIGRAILWCDNFALAANAENA
jgi:hypothetical protein